MVIYTYGQCSFIKKLKILLSYTHLPNEYMKLKKYSVKVKKKYILIDLASQEIYNTTPNHKVVIFHPGNYKHKFGYKWYTSVFK